MKNKRKKRKLTTRHQKPIISKDINTVAPPFIHNLIYVMLPKNLFQHLKIYERYIDEVIEKEHLPPQYCIFHKCCGDPECTRVVFDVKSDPHTHEDQYCYYGSTHSQVINQENTIATIVPETSSSFDKAHLNCPGVKGLDILTVEQLQHLWKKLIISTISADDRPTKKQIYFEGDKFFSPFPPQHAHIIQDLGT